MRKHCEAGFTDHGLFGIITDQINNGFLTPESWYRLTGIAVSVRRNGGVKCSGILRSDNTPINMTIASMGCLNQSLVHPREMLKAAFLSNAAAIMMFHNHPSGELNPSREDIAITHRMQQICTMAGIPVLDHIIIGNDRFYYSFREKDILPMEDVHYSSELSDINLKVAEKEAVKYGYKKESLNHISCGIWHDLGLRTYF